MIAEKAAAMIKADYGVWLIEIWSFDGKIDEYKWIPRFWICPNEALFRSRSWEKEMLTWWSLVVDDISTTP
jgi:hypothetical protein